VAEPRTGGDDEAVERELFVQRSRVVRVGQVPPLERVLRRAGPRDAPMPDCDRGRIAVGVALAVACFAAVLGGQQAGRSWTGSAWTGSAWAEGRWTDSERAAVRDVDAGAPAVLGTEGALASWDSYGGDRTCRVDGLGGPDRAELACVAPLPAPIRVPVACRSEEICSLTFEGDTPSSSPGIPRLATLRSASLAGP
jgi:hypothetical protein